MAERGDTWEVSVSVNGTHILTIGTAHLCGIDPIYQHHDAIRSAAQNLLAFIGEYAHIDNAEGTNNGRANP